MPEVNPYFSRDWVEFPNPESPEDFFKCDLTWLTSFWNCIYGNGCCGIDEDKPNAGCCSDGAYYSDADDEARTIKVAERLTPDMWQYFDAARPRKNNAPLNISEVGHDKDRKTRMVDGSCIFLNRMGYEAPGYTGSFGCVLHHLAQKENVHFVETKPDVCWQLPIRRSFEVREFGDREANITVIGEYERLAWGDGGEEFAWYCTGNTEAHNGAEPVYISNRAELVHMMGEEAYAILKGHCDNRMELLRTFKERSLPLVSIHPASVGHTY